MSMMTLSYKTLLVHIYFVLPCVSSRQNGVSELTCFYNRLNGYVNASFIRDKCSVNFDNAVGFYGCFD